MSSQETGIQDVENYISYIIPMKLNECGSGQVVKEALEKNGVLDSLRARIRAQIFKIVDHPSRGPQRKELSNQNLIINELIREYLLFNNCAETVSVLIPETGQPEMPLDRSFLAARLGIEGNPTTRQK